MMIPIEQHVEWIADCIAHMEEQNLHRIEPEKEEWVEHVNEPSHATLYLGATQVFMPYVCGVGAYREVCDEVAANDYVHTERVAATRQTGEDRARLPCVGENVARVCLHVSSFCVRMASRYASPPPTRRAAAADQLRQEIIMGDLAPGEVIKDAELAERLGTSVTPVREAVAQLAMEGLVEAVPNRSKRVAPLTTDGVIDLAEVMTALATYGFERGVQRLSTAQITEMRAAVTAFQEAISEGDMARGYTEGVTFVAIVLRQAGNAELRRHVGLMDARTQRALNLRAGHDVWGLWIRGFTRTMEALEAGDRAEAVHHYHETLLAYEDELRKMKVEGA